MKTKTYKELKQEWLANLTPKATGLLTKAELLDIELKAVWEALINLLKEYDITHPEVEAALDDYSRLCKRRYDHVTK